MPGASGCFISASSSSSRGKMKRELHPESCCLIFWRLYGRQLHGVETSLEVCGNSSRTSLLAPLLLGEWRENSISKRQNSFQMGKETSEFNDKWSKTWSSQALGLGMPLLSMALRLCAWMWMETDGHVWFSYVLGPVAVKDCVTSSLSQSLLFSSIICLALSTQRALFFDSLFFIPSRFQALLPPRRWAHCYTSIIPVS